MEGTLRNLGIEALREALWGTHFCVFYETAEDLAEVLVPYVKAGLESNEFCILITSVPFDHEWAARALREAIPAFDQCLGKGRIEIVPHAQWYLKGGAFDVQGCLDLWVDKVNFALSEGYDGMRVAGNTSWLGKEDWRAFVEYERAVNGVMDRRPIIAMCCYLLAHCGASEAVDVVANHRVPLMKRRGQWELVESPDRRRAEEALQRSEAHYRGLVENAVDMICCLDIEGRLTYVSPPLLRTLGYARGELVGKSCRSVIAAEDQARTTTALVRTLRGDDLPPYEFGLRRKDGSCLPVEITSNAIYSADGEPIGTQAILRDVSDRRRAQEALRESEARLRAIFEAAKEVAFIMSDSAGADAQITDFSPGAEHIFGYTREEVVGRPSSILYLPEDLPRLSAQLKEVAEHEGWLRGETAMVRKSGEVFPALLTLYPLVNEGGGLRAVLGVAIDISERKRSEEELRLSEARRAQAERIAGLGHWDWDLTTNKVYWSDELYRLRGITPGDFGGTYEAFLELVHPDDREQVSAAVAHALAGTRPFDMGLRTVQPDGSVRFFRARAEVTFDGAGKPVRMLGTAQDVTERRQAEDRLRQYQQQLRRLASELARTEERERRRVAEYLHDRVGQPLAVAKIKLDELRQSPLPSALDKVLQATAELIDQALADAQSLTFELSCPVLYELGFEAAVEWLVEQTQERDGVATEFHSDQQPKPMTEDVRVVLFQGVRELLVNVVKHAQASSASVRVRRDGPMVHVTVADDGVGFAASDDVVEAEAGRGGGFGLFNLRERVEQLGGRLEIHSQPGRGTRVILQAPLETGNQDTGGQ